MFEEKGPLTPGPSYTRPLSPQKVERGVWIEEDRLAWAGRLRTQLGRRRMVQAGRRRTQLGAAAHGAGGAPITQDGHFLWF